MQTLHRAEFLYSPDLPSPLVDAAILVNDEDGRIAAVDSAAALKGAGDRRVEHQILMPGVVNAHIHLTDAGRTERVPGGEGLVPWVQTLMRTRSAGLTPEEQNEAVCATLEEMHLKGTAGIGEVVNNAATLPAMRRSGMHSLLIHELIAFRLDRVEAALAGADQLLDQLVNELNENGSGGQVRHALGAHAPYSVAPDLMLEIARRSRSAGVHFYQHLAEDPDERELYESGGGRWREFLQAIGAWEEAWHPPGLSPIPLYDRLGILDKNFVAVHLADATAQEIALLAARGVRAILSPRSNLHITGLFPDVRAMAAAGIPLALGTDGRGSSPDMDVFGEAAVILERLPDLSPGTLLHSLTAGGADTLGFEELGRLRPGTAPGLVSVEARGVVSPDLRSLEEAILLRAHLRERAV